MSALRRDSMSIIDKIKPSHLVVFIISMIIGGMGAHLDSTYGSLNPVALWDMLKSQEYRRSYMETKLECMTVMPSTGLSENVVDAICFDMARIKAKADYCEGKKLPICEGVADEDPSSR